MLCRGILYDSIFLFVNNYFKCIFQVLTYGVSKHEIITLNYTEAKGAFNLSLISFSKKGHIHASSA